MYEDEETHHLLDEKQMVWIDKSELDERDDERATYANYLSDGEESTSDAGETAAYHRVESKYNKPSCIEFIVDTGATTHLVNSDEVFPNL